MSQRKLRNAETCWESFFYPKVTKWKVVLRISLLRGWRVTRLRSAIPQLWHGVSPLATCSLTRLPGPSHRGDREAKRSGPSCTQLHCTDTSMSSAVGSESARSKIALITGITGQDGSYLAEFLLQKVRCASQFIQGTLHLLKLMRLMSFLRAMKFTESSVTRLLSTKVASSIYLCMAWIKKTTLALLAAALKL